MSYTMASVYLFIKFLFFYGLVRAQVKSDPLKEHWLFLGLLYSAGIAFLSYVFIVSWQSITWAPWQVRVAQSLDVSPWLAWVGESLILATLYFRLLARFDEGVMFWTLLLLGLVIVWF